MNLKEVVEMRSEEKAELFWVWVCRCVGLSDENGSRGAVLVGTWIGVWGIMEGGREHGRTARAWHVDRPD